MKTRTFGELREAVIEKAGTKDQFTFCDLSSGHREFWDEMNETEYDRGYDSEYLKPNSPALCDMKLLEDQEFTKWVDRSPV